MKLNIEANGETTRRILDFLAELEQDIDIHIEGISEEKEHQKEDINTNSNNEKDSDK